MNREAENAIRAELAREEKLLWAGRPQQGLRLAPTDALLIPFSLMWGGFAIFWEASVILMGAPVSFALFGIPFVGVGLYLIVGRFFVDAKQREQTYYGVTSERLIIISGLMSRSTKSLDLATLPQITLTEKADRSGTITLGPTGYFPGWVNIGNWPGAAQYGPPTFNLVEQARDVYDTIRVAQREVQAH